MSPLQLQRSIHTARKLIARARNEGIGSALSLIWDNLVHLGWRWRNFRYDRTYGVDTSGFIPPHDLDVASANKAFSSEYEPSPRQSVKFILESLPVAFEDYSFIDYGSGKGRVLLVASEYPFKQIIGVEFSRSLHETAQDNIARYRNKRQRCFAIESLYMDAEYFDIPDTPCVIYMFDPFGKEVIEKVLQNIKDSYLKHPRRIIIIYYAPTHIDVFDTAGFLKEMDAITLPADSSALKNYEVALYEMIG